MTPGDLQVEEDLASVALQIQRKRFYVDVKKNRRGIFMKIAEVCWSLSLAYSLGWDRWSESQDIVDVKCGCRNQG